MHLQVRTKVSRSEGVGAMSSDGGEVRPGSLVGVLDLLAGAGYNLRSVGGCGIEADGTFVFAVDHNQTDDAVRLLQANRYIAERVEVDVCEVDDRQGALAECLKGFAAEGRHIDELFVGTPRDGKVPVQITFVGGPHSTST